MQTIVEPKQHIDKLWGKQRVREDETYRLMKYVLRVDHEGKVLLHNAVTGKLVVLNRDEAEAFSKIPVHYLPALKQLIEDHYLIPVHDDEHQQVVNMRRILRKLENSEPSQIITKYTILPTTACNARCYYCFEHGIKTITMSQKTASDVVQFISEHCGTNKQVHITWFGGEPTVASDRIDEISQGLRDKGIQFYSDMTTNGYLFDEELVRKAKTLWNLGYLQICFDGLEKNHNKTKNFANAKDNPYLRTLRNVGLLLEVGIRVGMRMNFDLANCDDFEEFLKEASQRFKGNPALSVYAFPVIGEYRDTDGRILHGSNEWFREKIVQLNELSRNVHMFYGRQVLPHLKHHCCDAENRAAITITPDGSLMRCCQCVGADERVGTIWDGITDFDLSKSWNIYSDYDKCRKCAYYPSCVRVIKCPAKDRCLFMPEWNMRNERAIIQLYRSANIS